MFGRVACESCRLHASLMHVSTGPAWLGKTGAITFNFGASDGAPFVGLQDVKAFFVVLD